jgi:hypothetical protein
MRGQKYLKFQHFPVHLVGDGESDMHNPVVTLSVSILEETESVTTGFDEGGAGVVANRSPESCVVRILDSEASVFFGAFVLQGSRGETKMGEGKTCSVKH